jgi:hypothetical protein
MAIGRIVDQPDGPDSAKGTQMADFPLAATGAPMKLSIFCTLEVNDSHSEFYVPVQLGRGPAAKTITLSAMIESGQYEKQQNTPIRVDFGDGRYSYFAFRNKIIKVEEAGGASRDELLVHIKHFVLKKEKGFDKVSKEVEAFERMSEVEAARRQNIPDAVKLFVWQRDQGKCVKCGSNEKLEFDHVIPFAMGGSNTERNLQLLCESCNRSKGKSI